MLLRCFRDLRLRGDPGANPRHAVGKVWAGLEVPRCPSVQRAEGDNWGEEIPDLDKWHKMDEWMEKDRKFKLNSNLNTSNPGTDKIFTGTQVLFVLTAIESFLYMFIIYIKNQTALGPIYEYLLSRRLEVFLLIIHEKETGSVTFQQLKMLLPVRQVSCDSEPQVRSCRLIIYKSFTFKNRQQW